MAQALGEDQDVANWTAVLASEEKRFNASLTVHATAEDPEMLSDIAPFMRLMSRKQPSERRAGCWGSGLAVAGKEHSAITPPHADCIL